MNSKSKGAEIAFSNGEFNASSGAAKYVHQVDGIMVKVFSDLSEHPKYNPQQFEDLFQYKEKYQIRIKE